PVLHVRAGQRHRQRRRLGGAEQRARAQHAARSGRGPRLPRVAHGHHHQPRRAGALSRGALGGAPTGPGSPPTPPPAPPPHLHRPHLPSCPTRRSSDLLFFTYGPGNDTDSEDGSVALSSELELNMQRGAVEVLGFPESHMGIITNPDAQARFHEVLSALPRQVPAAPRPPPQHRLPTSTALTSPLALHDALPISCSSRTGRATTPTAKTARWR